MNRGSGFGSYFDRNIRLCICMYMCLYIYIYIYMYICMYIHICIGMMDFGFTGLPVYSKGVGLRGSRERGYGVRVKGQKDLSSF